MVHNTHLGDYTWDAISVLPYKEDGTHFKGISRQILFEGDPDLPCQLRYFEIAPGGHSTLERHEHIHVVMIIRGSGKALVGERIITLAYNDVLQIPKHQWHQLQACNNETLGFLCIVHTNRDRPEFPDENELAQLRSNQQVAAFVKI